MKITFVKTIHGHAKTVRTKATSSKMKANNEDYNYFFLISTNNEDYNKKTKTIMDYNLSLLSLKLNSVPDNQFPFSIFCI